jgi:hypothetical protein
MKTQQPNKCIAALSLALMSLLLMQSANAYDCVVDANGDGLGDGTYADSDNYSDRLACGYLAEATQESSIAMGPYTDANS